MFERGKKAIALADGRLSTLRAPNTSPQSYSSAWPRHDPDRFCCFIHNNGVERQRTRASWCPKRRQVRQRHTHVLMARKSKKGKPSAVNKNGWIYVDPARVRFQHSRIRPYFSGCGRSVQETLDSIRRKELAPNDLPPIQVRYARGKAICLVVANLIFCFLFHASGDCRTGG